MKIPQRVSTQMETTMDQLSSMALAALTVSTLLSPTLAAEANATRDQHLFAACAACHSLEPDRSMTGRSLAGLWNRKAGSLASFPRYSSA